MENRTAPPVSREVGNVLRGKYKQEGMSQAKVAERAGMSITTLQKKIAGKSPITTDDLILIAGAIGVSAAGVMNEAIERAGGVEELLSQQAVSEAPVSNVTQMPQRKKRATELSIEELEQQKHAAYRDPEAEEDEHFD